MELVDGLEVTEDGREHVRREAAVARHSTVEHLGEGVSIVLLCYVMGQYRPALRGPELFGERLIG